MYHLTLSLPFSRRTGYQFNAQRRRERVVSHRSRSSQGGSSKVRTKTRLLVSQPQSSNELQKAKQFLLNHILLSTPCKHPPWHPPTNKCQIETRLLIIFRHYSRGLIGSLLCYRRSQLLICSRTSLHLCDQRTGNSYRRLDFLKFCDQTMCVVFVNFVVCDSRVITQQVRWLVGGVEANEKSKAKWRERRRLWEWWRGGGGGGKYALLFEFKWNFN